MDQRQFCRKGIHTCIPAVTLTFRNGAGRLHWCAEHADDAERYRPSSDQRPGGWVDAVDFMNELSLTEVEAFYTPAAGDADQYNELGQLTGYVHRSAG